MEILELSPDAAFKLKAYEALLHKWQKSINLVAPSTLEHSWDRHFMDSAQLLVLLPDREIRIYDIGSGAGFPGAVLAACNKNYDVTLIESDQKKCQFLKTVSRESGLQFNVKCARIEDCYDLPAPDVISARALAPLAKLLGYCMPWAEENDDLALVFLKGKCFEQELKEARSFYDFECVVHQSALDSQGAILYITGLRP